MMKMKSILCAVMVVGVFSLSGVGCAEKPPAKNEIKVTTPGGTTVTIEKPGEAPGRNPPPVRP